MLVFGFDYIKVSNPPAFSPFFEPLLLQRSASIASEISLPCSSNSIQASSYLIRIGTSDRFLGLHGKYLLAVFVTGLEELTTLAELTSAVINSL